MHLPGRVGAALVFVGACAHAELGPPVRAPIVAPTVAAAPAATAPAASSSAPEADPPRARAPDAVRTPDALEAVRDVVAGAVGVIDTVWTLGDETFVLARRGGPAHFRAAELAYPLRAREAASGGRVVVFAEVWRWKEGHLARVMARPVEVRSMVCEQDEDCSFVELDVTVSLAGEVVVEPGTCAAALAVIAAEKDTNTFTAFDAAVIPAACRAPGIHRWDGGTFRLQTPTPDAAARPPTARRVERDAEPEAMAAAMTPGAIARSVDVSWAGPSGDERLVALRATYPAPIHAFFSHDAASRVWESGRAIEVTEVWLARDGSFRRLLQLPTGLGSLAEPNRVLAMSVEAGGGELTVCGDRRVGPPTSRVVPDAPLTPLELDLLRRDDAASLRMVVGCGTYRFDGRALVKQGARRASSF